MVLCIVWGCGSKSGKHKGLGFFRIPKIITDQGEEYEELTRKRRERWISAVSRGDTAEKNILETERVCGRHFHQGQPAKYFDQFSPDWVPSLNLGKKEYRRPRDFKASVERSERVERRRKAAIEQQEQEATKKRKLLEQSGDRICDIDFESGASTSETTEEQLTDGMNTDNFCDWQGAKCESKEFAHSSTQTEPEVAPTAASEGTQTEEFEYLFERPCGYKAPGRDFFDTDDKVRFYTGLPSIEVLLKTFEHVAPSVNRKSLTLDKFQEFIIVLMKLRLNVPFQDLAYRFSISVSTASRIFSYWIRIMDARLSPLVYWPERHQLWHTMPMCFKYSFGNKVTVIIDCFEVFIEKPSNLLARAQTFSSYKHHNTIKILIGITPQGTICYVSKAWGGRTSDKHITENCGFLEKLLPGDLVMADRGFTISESVGLKQAKLVIPVFTKGLKQLDPIDVEQTRGIANVRIHVERVIGLLRRKYTILEGILPTDFLSSNHRGTLDFQVPLIDRILRVCSALVNLCPPIVPFD